MTSLRLRSHRLRGAVAVAVLFSSILIKIDPSCAYSYGFPSGGEFYSLQKRLPPPQSAPWWSDLKTTSELKLDSSEQGQTTFDGSKKFNGESPPSDPKSFVAEAIPGLFNPLQYIQEIEPTGLAVVYSDFPQGSGDRPGNVLVTGGMPRLSLGKISVYRFACVHHPCKVGFGFSNEAKFDSGWKAEALYITSNGNLAGRGLIKSRFTRGHTGAHFVDLVVESTKDLQVNIYIVQDSIPQGKAFSLDFSSEPELISSLCPFLSFEPEANNVVAVVGFQPVPLQPMQMQPYRTQPSIVDPWQPYLGTWRMVVNRDEQQVPVTVTIDNYDRCGIKIVNHGLWKCQFSFSGYISASELGPTTRMFPTDPIERAVEKIVFDRVPNLRAWGMAGDDSLTLSDADLELNWVFSRVKNEPSCTNPFIERPTDPSMPIQ